MLHRNRFWNKDGSGQQDKNDTSATNVPKETDSFPIEKEKVSKYQRHKHVDLRAEKNVKRRKRLELQQRLNAEAAVRLAASEYLLTEESGCLEADEGEQTYKYKQSDIVEHLDIESAAKAFKFTLSGGPYNVRFSRNGRYMVSGGSKGNLAVVDVTSMKAVTEVQVNETVRDVTFLQNHTMWASAQKKYVYIYDHNGLELHCLREHMLTHRLEFLPFHYILTTIGEFGELRYLDVSTGLVAAAYKTKRGPCDTMCQNPATGIISLGHVKGSVSLWTPNVGKPVVEFLAHGGKVTALSQIKEHYLATAGVDGTWKVWDSRRFQPVHRFHYFGAPPKAIAASQTGILGIGFGPHVQMWKDVTTLGEKPKTPYLTHEMPGDTVESLAFRPFEDFCCVGSLNGIQSIVVPGSGLANFDSYYADPYETKKVGYPEQRQEREVHSLLEKLPASTITFNPGALGMLDEAPRVVIAKEEEEKHKALEEAKAQGSRPKNKAKGKASTAARQKVQRKQHAEFLREKAQRQQQNRALQQREKLQEGEAHVDLSDTEMAGNSPIGGADARVCIGEPKKALDRFRKKKAGRAAAGATS